MIKINTLKIGSSSSKIDVDVEAATGSKIVKVLFWTKDTYGDVDAAIDLSYLLDGTSEIEQFQIQADYVEVEMFTELYFLEFTSNEKLDKCDVECDIEMCVVGNFTSLHECFLNSLAKLTIEDCEITMGIDSCEDCLNMLFLINSLIDGLYTSLEYFYFEEGIEIYNKIKELCKDCVCYDEEEASLNLSGVETKLGENAYCIGGNIIERYGY